MALVLAVDPQDPDPRLIARAAAVLSGGGLVAFPTETVYGLGADAFDAAAVARIFEAKGRPADDPIIVHVLAADDLDDVATAIPPLARELAAAFWPGPLTLLVPRGHRVPTVVTAGLDSVAVRAPSAPVARALLAAADGPIAAPSANLFGHPSPTTAGHVLADLGDRIDVVLDAGPTPVGIESTVLDVGTAPPLILRPGGVTIEELRAIVPGVRLAERSPASQRRGMAGHPRGSVGPLREPTDEPSRSPGQLPRHYAPRARLVLVLGADATVGAVLARAAADLVAAGRRVGLLVAADDRPALADLPPGARVLALAALGDPAGAARHLFGALRELDEAGCQVILARDFGAQGLGLAVRDRLTRAAENAVVSGGDDEAATAAAIVALVEGGRE